MRIHYEQEKEKKRMERFTCSICSKVFSKKNNLEIHMDLKHMDKQEFKSGHIPSSQVIFLYLVKIFLFLFNSYYKILIPFLHFPGWFA